MHETDNDIPEVEVKELPTNKSFGAGGLLQLEFERRMTGLICRVHPSQDWVKFLEAGASRHRVNDVTDGRYGPEATTGSLTLHDSDGATIEYTIPAAVEEILNRHNVQGAWRGVVGLKRSCTVNLGVCRQSVLKMQCGRLHTALVKIASEFSKPLAVSMSVRHIELGKELTKEVYGDA